MAKINITGKSVEERMETARETAMNYFRQGLNCSECVLRTFLDMHDTGLPDEVMCMCTGFGGGIGRTKNICGAISGAVMAVGTVKGRKDPFEKEDVKDRIKQLGSDIYPVFSDIVNEIEGKYGTLLCRELSDPYGDFDGKPRKKNCMQLIGECAALAEKTAFK